MESQGSVTVDELGQIWWTPVNGVPQLLADCDSLCGAGIFHTTPDDPFRDCCSWHDRAYQLRNFFECRGWDRKRIDDYFLTLMLNIAGEDSLLRARAHIYYSLVRMLGWTCYYAHLGYYKLSKDVECLEMLKQIIGEDYGSKEEIRKESS